jgi:hypothetical protein
MAARSMAWACGRSLTGIAGLNPPEDVCLVHGSRTESDVCVCVCVCVCVIERDKAQQSPSTPTVGR